MAGEVIKLPYIDIQTYFQDNVFKKVTKCPLQCHQTFDSMQASQEHFLVCPQRLIECEECLAMMNQKELVHHEESCPEKIVDCQE